MKKFISSLIASLTIAAPAMASPLPADHQVLVNTLKEDGIKVLVNEPANVCFDGSTRNGVYGAHRGTRYLVVCQDNRSKAEFNINEDVSFIAPWTANDLDTIRHETTHIIQDCMVGPNNDGKFDTIFTSLADVIDSYGVVDTMRIINGYLDLYKGDRNPDIKYEIEAFYAARSLSATEITAMYKKYCR